MQSGEVCHFFYAAYSIINSAHLAMLYNPCISYMSEWFVARRGLANGVINAGTATGGLILPLALPTLLDRYGSSKTLRILAIIFTALLLPVLPFLRGRLPHGRVRRPPSKSNAVDSTSGWLKNRNFQFLMIVNTLQGFGEY
jgi:MCP family monocarboxylic acid transporter-like MFS transporter 10